MNLQVRLFFLLLTLLISFNTNCSHSPSQIKTIYNSDSRTSVDSLSDPNILTLSDSVALIAQRFRIMGSDDKNATFRTSTIGNILGLCSSEKFLNDLIIGDCTGFLISNELLVTAGHCIKTETECAEKIFIFGHTDSQRSSFSNNEIYACSRIASRLEKATGDLVLVKLDRPVQSRPGTRRFRIPDSDSPSLEQNSSEIVSVGHPLGTSMKIAPLKKLLPARKQFFFQAQLDVAQGASGSPLFDPRSGTVHGVLVGGSNDFDWDKDAGCARSHVCSGDACRGEEFASISSIKALVSKTSAE